MATALGSGLQMHLELTPALLARLQSLRAVHLLFTQVVMHHGAASADRCVLDADGALVLAHLHVGQRMRTVQLRWPQDEGA